MGAVFKRLMQAIVLLGLVGAPFAVYRTAAQGADGEAPGLTYLRGGDIWLLEARSADARRITGNGEIVAFEWSPDGRHIIAHADEHHVFMVDLASGASLDLGEDCYPADYFPDVWSPDGQTLLLQRCDFEKFAEYYLKGHAYVVQPDGAEIAERPYGLLYPVWDAAGRYIHSFWDEMGVVNLSTADVLTGSDPSDPTPLLPNHRIRSLQPAPSSGWVALFTEEGYQDSCDGSGLYLLSFVKTDEGRVKRYPEEGECGQFCGYVGLSGDASGAWSADGTRYAFFPEESITHQLERPSEAVLVVYDAETGEVRTPWDRGGLNPAWSPDGGYLSVTALDGALVLIEVESAASRELMPGASREALVEYPDYCDGGTYGYLAPTTMASTWSPDGKFIAFNYSDGFYVVKVESGDAEWIEGGTSPQWAPVLQETRPPGVKDLIIGPNLSPEEKTGTVRLQWTVPMGEGGSAGSVVEYDIRYGTKALDESTWATATPLSDAPPPLPASSLQVWTTEIPNGTYQHLYVGMKCKFEDGTWSAISNVAEWWDIGFRPGTDGYQLFGNMDGLDRYHVGGTELEEMFGRDAVSDAGCEGWSGSICLTERASNWMEEVNARWRVGVCTGMAVTSLHTYTQGIEAASLVPGAEAVSEFRLDDDEVRSSIARYHSLQYANPVLERRMRLTEEQLPSDAVEALKEAMANPDLSQFVLMMENPAGGGHAVTPFALSSLPDGRWKVWVYDPHQALESIEVDEANEGWESVSPGRYPTRAEIAATTETICDGEKRRLGSLENWTSACFPHSMYVLEEELFFGGTPALPGYWQMVMLSVSRPRRLVTVEDHAGAAIDVEQNLIPGASVLPWVGEDRESSGVDYFLPVDGTYDVRLTGEASDAGGDATLWYDGPDISLAFSGLDVRESAEHRVRVEPERSVARYTPGQDGRIDIAMAVYRDNEDWRVDFSNFEAREGVGTWFSLEGGAVWLHHNGPESTSYDLQVELRDSSGVYSASLGNVELGGGGAQAIEVVRTAENGTPELAVDLDGDGAVDKRVAMREGVSVGGLLRGALRPAAVAGLTCLCAGGLAAAAVSGLVVIRRRRSVEGGEDGGECGAGGSWRSTD